MLLRSPWKTTVRALRALCEETGLQVVQSFDLQDARRVLPDESSPTCPYHGTSRCSCQFLVFLVYGDADEPATVVVRGHDMETEITIEESGAAHGRPLSAVLFQLLDGTVSFG